MAAAAKKLPHVRAFVLEVMKVLNVPNARQLADALGMTDIDRERRVRRWLDGENAPGFDYTMSMLEKAEFLTPAGASAWHRAATTPMEAAQAAAAAAHAGEAHAGRAAQATRPRRVRGSS